MKYTAMITIHVVFQVEKLLFTLFILKYKIPSYNEIRLDKANSETVVDLIIFRKASEGFISPE